MTLPRNHLIFLSIIYCAFDFCFHLLQTCIKKTAQEGDNCATNWYSHNVDVLTQRMELYVTLMCLSTGECHHTCCSFLWCLVIHVGQKNISLCDLYIRVVSLNTYYWSFWMMSNNLDYPYLLFSSSSPFEVICKLHQRNLPTWLYVAQSFTVFYFIGFKKNNGYASN